MTGLKKRALAVLLALVFILNGVPTALAAEATTVQLAKTEGTVAISNSSGRAVSLIEKMRVYSGYHLKTEEASYAWLNLDSAKLCKLDAVSEMEVRKSGKKLELLLDEGNLFFNVTEPLSDDESFNIRTSTMTVGIRGTCGWVRSIDQWTSQVYVLEGAVETAVSDPVTGETKSETIAAGESAVCKVYPQDRKGDKCDIIRGAYSEADIDGFVLTEVVPDEGLCGRIYDDSGLDLRSSSADDRLRQDQAAVHEKLAEIESQLSRQEDHLSPNTVWSDPEPVPTDSSSRPSDDNEEDDDDDGGSYEDGGYDPWPGTFDPPVIPDTPTIPDPPVTPRIITLTMPQEDNTVDNYLARSTVVGVILQPGPAARSVGTLGTARASTANLLEVDSGITVPAGKTLTLQPGVGLSVLSGQTVQVAGSLTVGGTCAVAGTLLPASGAAVRAFAFDLTAPIPGWAVSDAADSQGYYSLIPAQAVRYTVAFDAGGGSVTPASAVTGADGKLTSLPTPTREGYTFDGWFTAGGTQVTTGTVFMEDTTVYAHWTETVVPPPASITYTVSFDTNGGIVSLTSASTGADGKLASLPTPTREGYTFDGWFTAGGTQVTESTVFAADTTVYAHWTEIVVPPPAPVSYTVTFDANGGSVTPTSGTTGADGKLASLPTPAREGYIFDGWFDAATGGTSVDGNTEFTADTTIYAQWTPRTYTITFDANGGSVSPASGTTGADGTLTSLPTPAREGYIFDGWFDAATGGTSVDGNTEFTADTIIYAHWTKIYTVTFNANGGSVDPASAATDTDGKLAALPIPTCEGYLFDGWFTAAGTQVTENTVFTENTVVYAQWKKGNMTWRIVDGTLYIEGSGPMENYDSTNPAPWKDLSFTNAVIENGVTTVGAHAFEYCGSLENVTIPDGVTTIGDSAFSGCGSLTDVYYGGTAMDWDKITITGDNTPIAIANANIHYAKPGVAWRIEGDTLYIYGSGPMENYDGKAKVEAPWYGLTFANAVIKEGVTSVGNWAFYKCAGLKSVTIPSGVTTIGSYAFDYCADLPSVAIPEGVTTIGDGVFMNCKSLESATIPDSVTTIGGGLFSNCTMLKEAVIPDSVTSLGESAFISCSSLTSVKLSDNIPTFGTYMFLDCTSLTELKLPANLKSIGEGAIRNCTGLTSVEIPEGVESIGMFAFQHCTGLQSVTIPNSVTRIEAAAFMECAGLQSVEIPNSVTAIEGGLFDKCSSLESVTIPDSVTSINVSAFTGCSKLNTFVVADGNTAYASEGGVLFNRDKTTLLLYPQGKPDNSYTIPASVTGIGERAFSGCTGLADVMIPDSVASIGDRAFDKCTGLTDVYYVGTAAEWGEITVGTNNDPLTHANIHYVESAGTNVYWELSGGVLRIWGTGPMEDYTSSAHAPWFSENASITTVVIEKGVTSIGGWAFKGCANLTGVTIPDGVASIGTGAFWECGSLTGVTIPNGVSSIGTSAFCRCSSLTGVTIPDSVTTIGSYAFWMCSSLESATIPNRLVSINESTFASCSSLTGVTIPDSVATINQLAFSGCTKLTDVYYSGTQAQWDNIAIDDNGNDPLLSAQKHFSGVYTVTFNANGGSVDPASAATGAGGTLDSLPTPTCAGYTFDGWFTAADGGEEVTADTVFTADTTVYAQWTAISVGHRIVDGTLYIEGTGKMESMDGWYASSYAPWSAHNKDIKEVIIADGVTSIGKYAFLDCSSLTSVTIPDTVTDIGICAFADCSSLTGVTIPDSVTSIGNGAFEYCSSLTGVTIPDSVTSIGDNAFADCRSLTSVTIPDGISAIRSFTFDWCIALESVTIPASVTSIESHAFDMAGKGKIDTVNYGGTEDAWKAVAIAEGNDPLTKATINYNNYTATLSLAGRAVRGKKS